MIRRPPRSTQSRSSAASDVYKRQVQRMLGRASERRPERQVLDRVAGHGHLGEGDEGGAVPCGLLAPFEDRRGVALDVTDTGVDLRERDPQRGHGWKPTASSICAG